MNLKNFPAIFLKNPKDKALARGIRNIFGFTPGNIYLYKLAFRHKSVSVELNANTRISNERLEYLGDAILSAVVADYLFKLFPLKDEGFLTEMRSKMVSRAQLNKLSQKLGLAIFIESAQDNQNQFKSMMGDAFEAFIGALYLDKGYVFARRIIVDNIIGHHYDLEMLETTEFNFKSKLLEWSQREKRPVEYVVVEEVGRSHKKQYTIEVRIDGETVAIGIDFSIKGAEQNASEKAMLALDFLRQTIS